MLALSWTCGRATRSAALLLLAATTILFADRSATGVASMDGTRLDTVHAQGGSTWRPLPPTETRFGHAALYDAVGRRMTVLVGAASLFAPGDPISLDLTTDTWSALETTGETPGPRTGTGPVRGSGMALDLEERVAMLACDCAGGSTFLFDLAASRWTRAPRDELALQRVGGSVVYDPMGDQMLLLGGRQYGIEPILAAAHAYDMSDARAGWRSLPDAPFARADASAAYIDHTRQVLVFGGQTDDGDFTKTLWRWDAQRPNEPDAWRDLTDLAGPGPSGRVGASFVYVPDLRSVVLYGGYAPGEDNDDLWILDYGQADEPRWVSLTAATPGAGPRAAHAAIWDEGGARMIVHGGTRGEGRAISLLADAWALPASGLAPGPKTTPSPVPTPPGEVIPALLPALYRSAQP